RGEGLAAQPAEHRDRAADVRLLHGPWRGRAGSFSDDPGARGDGEACDSWRIVAFFGQVAEGDVGPRTERDRHDSRRSAGDPAARLEVMLRRAAYLAGGGSRLVTF